MSIEYLLHLWFSHKTVYVYVSLRTSLAASIGYILIQTTGPKRWERQKMLERPGLIWTSLKTLHTKICVLFGLQHCYAKQKRYHHVLRFTKYTFFY
jgi:hypothetical protein